MKNQFFLNNIENNVFRAIMSMEVEYKYGSCGSSGSSCMSVSAVFAEI